MPYTILDAMKDEIILLDDMIQWSKNEEKIIAESIYTVQKQTLEHIICRMGGYDFYLHTDANGKKTIGNKKTNRKSLEEEYPALKKAAENYNLLEKLIDSTPDD